MANYAYVKNGQIVGVYDYLPQNWENISNFNTLNDWTYYNYLGWQQIIKDIPVYNPATQKIDFDKHVLINGIVHEQYKIINLPVAPPPPPPSTPSFNEVYLQIKDIVQNNLDIFAQSRGYIDIIDCCSYALTKDTLSSFYLDGTACVQLRNDTWSVFYQIFKDIFNNIRPMIYTYGDIASEFPELIWPNPLPPGKIIILR